MTTTTCRTAEERVLALIEETNRVHAEGPVARWVYELTFVVESGDFQACVADEIIAWYLIQELVGS
jgi:hypothetical protein